MIKVKLTNRMAQALPVLIRDLDNPKNLRQISIPKKRSKLITEGELSQHCQDLFERGHLAIARTGRPDAPLSAKPAPVKAEEKKEEPVKVAAPAPITTANKKSSRSRKKGRK